MAYHKDDPNDNITNSESFKFKAIITRLAPAADNTQNVKTTVTWKYLSILEMSLINCNINCC